MTSPYRIDIADRPFNNGIYLDPTLGHHRRRRRPSPRERLFGIGIFVGICVWSALVLLLLGAGLWIFVQALAEAVRRVTGGF